MGLGLSGDEPATGDKQAKTTGQESIKESRAQGIWRLGYQYHRRKLEFLCFASVLESCFFSQI
jgi:hypothetical protein